MEYLSHPNSRRLLDLYKTLATLQLINFHLLLSVARFADSATIVGLETSFPNVLSLLWQTKLLDTLFAVSAFLAGCLLFHEQKTTGTVDIRDYYLRRVSRLLPLYYLALVIYALAADHPFSSILQSALFVQYIFGPTYLNPVIPVGWTMEMMMFFFIVMPFIVMGLARVKRPLVWLFAALLALLAWRFIYMAGSGESFKSIFPDALLYRKESPVYFEIYFRIWFRIAPFVLGLIFAYLFVMDQRLMKKVANTPALRWTLIVLAWVLMITGGMLPVQDPNSFIYQGTSERFWLFYWAFSPITFTLGTMLAVMIVATGPLREKSRVPRWLDYLIALGSRNLFAVYLFHFPMIAAAAVIWFQSTDREVLLGLGLVDWFMVWLLATVLTFAIAIPLTNYVELPVQKFLRNKLGRKKS